MMKSLWARAMNLGLIFALLSSSAAPLAAHAATPGSGFSVQVTPSPLVTTVKPGQTTDMELKIRNGGTDVENLKIEPRSFRIDPTIGTVQLGDTPPADVKDWVSFDAPNFTVQPGQWYTQKVRFALPKDTGFSYSFALVISRQKEQASTVGGRLIKGSVAVFTLINVDRPGATRKLDVASFSVSKHVYEYLPSHLSIKLKNAGNSIVQPYGNVFVQRGGTQLATLPVNEQQGYILPGVQRNLQLDWSDGFPHHTETTAADGTKQDKLVWNWPDASKLRIGKYTAKLVAVYNDGGHDVPIEGEVSFWVFPWKIVLGAIVVLLLLLFALWTLARKIITTVRKISGKNGRQRPKDNPDTRQ